MFSQILVPKEARDVSPKFPDLIWGSPRLLFHAYDVLIPKVQTHCSVQPSPPTVAEVKNESSYTPPPQYTVIACTRTVLLHFASGECHAQET
jgi:hypothetical protein